MGVTLVVGRFSPLHRGHEALLAAAVALGRPVVVLSYAHPEAVGCPAMLRERWLQEVAARQAGIAEVVVRAPPQVPEDDATAEDHRAFCASVCVERGWPVDAVATGEDYGEGFAAYLTTALGRPVVHARTDRALLRVSGTAVRADPFAHRDQVHPQVLRDYLHQRRAAVLAEAGLSRAQIYDAFLGRLDEVDVVVSFLRRLRCSGRILDAGCGTGRLLPAYTAAGWQAIGLDPDTDYVAAARARGDARVGTFLDAPALGPFDAVVLANGPWIYLPSAAARRASLRALGEALLDGGRLVLDLPNLPWLGEHYQEPSPVELQLGGHTVVRTPRHAIDRDAGHWVHSDEVCIDGRSYVEIWPFRMLDGDTLLSEVRAAGFEHIQLWTGWTARQPTTDPTHRLLLTARRGPRAPRSR